MTENTTLNDDSYEVRRARLFEAHGIPLDPRNPSLLGTELDSRGLRVDQSDWVDLPDSLRQTVKLIDQNGKVVAWGRAANIRDAKLKAFERYLNGEHDPY